MQGLAPSFPTAMAVATPHRSPVNMISSVSLVENNNQIGSQLWKKAGDSAARMRRQNKTLPNG
jgi:hypothetical protein